MIRLKPNNTLNSSLNFTLRISLPSERRPAQLCLEEELGVEDERGGVKGRSWGRGVYVVCSGDRVTTRSYQSMYVRVKGRE